jgi:hypothetical protein
MPVCSVTLFSCIEALSCAHTGGHNYHHSQILFIQGKWYKNGWEEPMKWGKRL